MRTPSHFAAALLDKFSTRGFNRGQSVRTLVDLKSNERGYVRIYAEREGFGYQLSTYSPTVVGDLFEQMSGYSTIDDASAAANFQLSAIHQPLSRRRKRR